MVFHYRLRRSYKCITADPKAADLYYVPFYASLDVMRWHFRKDATLEATNHLSHSFVRWLAKHESFKVSRRSYTSCMGCLHCHQASHRLVRRGQSQVFLVRCTLGLNVHPEHSRHELTQVKDQCSTANCCVLCCA